MDTYLVGGAVRDALLGLPVTDRDHVVVGATPEEMGALGYVAVGRDFPVFLHPETHEEYALARTERKSGPGYRGFVVASDPSVTLEQDLERRDLTVNAMARRASGEIVDPRGGRADLDARLLRHVSQAFVEDPVRILRVARFMARFEPLGFAVAGDTLELMRSMVDAGEVAALVPERVWQETEKALGAARPRAFVETLQACNALRVILPGLGALFDGDAARGETTLDTLDAACERSEGIDVRFAALCHDVGERPEVAEDGRGPLQGADTSALERLCDAVRVPKSPRELALMVRRWQVHCHRARELSPDALGALLQALDVIRRPERFERFLLVCGTIRETPGIARLRAAAGAWASVDPGTIAATTEPKSAIPETILAARIAALVEP